MIERQPTAAALWLRRFKFVSQFQASVEASWIIHPARKWFIWRWVSPQDLQRANVPNETMIIFLCHFFSCGQNLGRNSKSNGFPQYISFHGWALTEGEELQTSSVLNTSRRCFLFIVFIEFQKWQNYTNLFGFWNVSAVCYHTVNVRFHWF